MLLTHLRFANRWLHWKELTFRLLIHPKPLCFWGVGRGHFNIYALQSLSHPRENTFGRHLCQLPGHKQCHFQQGQTAASVLACHCLTLRLGLSVMLSLPSASHQWCGVAKQHLSCPSVGHRLPRCGSSDFEDKGLL